MLLNEYATKLADAYDNHVMLQAINKCINTETNCITLNKDAGSFTDKTNVTYKVKGPILKNIVQNHTGPTTLSFGQAQQITTALQNHTANHNTSFGQSIEHIGSNMEGVAETYSIADYNEMKRLRNELDFKMRDVYNDEETDKQIMFDSSTYLNLGLTVAATSVVYFLVTNL